MEKFLVRGQITKREYMQDDEEIIDDMAFVMAYDKAAAEYLFEEHWKNKTSEYSVYYRVVWCETVRTING